VLAWFGLSLMVGFDEPSKAGERLALPFLNGAALLVASFLTYAALRLHEPPRAKR
jgi:hypothetical protein